MATFSLGDAVHLTRDVSVGVDEAYGRSKALLANYANLGLRVQFSDEQPPHRVGAEVSNPEGTRIHATVALTPIPTGSALEIRLDGRVHVGGMKGMLATEGLVRQTVMEKLTSFIDVKFPAGEVYSPPAPASAPETETETETVAGDAPSAQPTPAPGSPEGKLALIKDLFDRGLISDADYRSKKTQLLERL